MAPREKFTECKVGYIKKSGKGHRVLQYVNNRTGKVRTLTVGKRGGISYKAPGKTRRYMRSTCKKTKVSSTFWNTLEELKKKKQS